MSKKSENAKTQAKEALARIKANLPGNSKFDPKNNTLGFKPNARLGSINRSRR